MSERYARQSASFKPDKSVSCDLMRQVVSTRFVDDRDPRPVLLLATQIYHDLIFHLFIQAADNSLAWNLTENICLH